MNEDAFIKNFDEYFNWAFARAEDNNFSQQSDLMTQFPMLSELQASEVVREAMDCYLDGCVENSASDQYEIDFYD